MTSYLLIYLTHGLYSKDKLHEIRVSCNILGIRPYGFAVTRHQHLAFAECDRARCSLAFARNVRQSRGGRTGRGELFHFSCQREMIHIQVIYFDSDIIFPAQIWSYIVQ